MMYFNQLISLSDNKTKTMRNTVKTETGTKCHPTTMPSVLEKDNLVNNPNQAAEAFNSYFLILVQKLKLQDVQVHSVLLYLVSHNSNHYPIMLVVPVTEVEIIGIIGSLKNKNSSGSDGISNKILRSCGHVISQSLSHTFNKSLSLAVFPGTLKYAIIKPLFKNGNYITLQITE